MSKISIAGASTGTATFTIESPATSTNRTLTLPDNTGTILTNATAGTVLQVVQGITTTPRLDMTTNTPVQRVSLSITPTSATSKILLFYTAGDCFAASGGKLSSAFYRNGSSIHQFTDETARGDVWVVAAGNFLHSPNTTSAITYAVFHWNKSSGSVHVGDGNMPSVLTAMEIAA
jgi:hypothetical protein